MIEKQRTSTKTKNVPNIHYTPVGFNYTVCFYSNCNDYFIYDTEDFDLVKNYSWHRKTDEKGIARPRAWIDGRNIYFSRYIMKTPEGMECDHINHNPEDNRKHNLRNCTKAENLRNREKGQGRIEQNEDGTFSIIGYVLADASKKYISEEEAIIELERMHDKDPFSYKNSQKTAKEIESYRFTETKYFGGILEKIDNLPQRHYLKVWLTNINCLRANGGITEEQEVKLLSDIVSEYKKEFCEN